MERLFSDQRKFKVLNEDPTIRNLRTVQNYLNTLCNRGEITELEKKEMCPKFAQIVRTHGLPKIHKSSDMLPSFRPIVDTTNTPHYGIGKYLSSLLNPLTYNDYSVKDTFEAVNKICSTPPELFEQGYRYYSLDVVSLFTNVPLNRTIKIILK